VPNVSPVDMSSVVYMDSRRPNRKPCAKGQTPINFAPIFTARNMAISTALAMTALALTSTPAFRK